MKDKFFDEIYDKAVETTKTIRAFKQGADRDNPVDIDIIKTSKAMFFEEVIEILKKYKEEEKQCYTKKEAESD